MTGLLQIAIRFGLETESLFTSVERIKEYINEPTDDERSQKQNKPTSWPQSGDIE